MTAWRGSAGTTPSGAGVLRRRRSAARALRRRRARRRRGSRSSQIGATWALDSIRSVPGATGNTAVGVPAAAHTIGKRPRSGSITTRIDRARPNGGMPPMVKPVSSLASFAFARRTSGSPVTAARRARSTRLGPETRHRIGSSAPASAGATNTSDLTIWPSSASTAPAASSRGVGRLREHPHVQGHALPGGGVDDSLDRRGIGRLGHGGSLQPAVLAPARPGRIAIVIARDAPAGSPMTGGRHVVVVAAGDVPARDGARPAPGRAGRTGSTPSSPRTGASPRPTRSGSRRRWSSATWTPPTPARVEAAAAAGVPVIRTSSDKDESDTELARARGRAPRRDADHRAGRARRAAARPRARQRVAARRSTPWAASRRPCSTSGVRVTLLEAPGPDGVGRAARRELPGVVGATVSLLPVRRRRRGRDDAGPALPAARTSRSPPVPPAACPTCATGADAAVAVRRGRLLIIESAT